MNKKNILFICTLLFVTNIFSQQDTTLNSDPRFLFSQAEEYLLNENYEKAIPLYKQLIVNNPQNSNWNFKLGICYLYSPSEYSKAISCLEKAVVNTANNTNDESFKEERSPLLAIKFLADAYHRNYRFTEAIDTYNKFLNALQGNAKVYKVEIENQIQVCKNAIDLVASPVNMIIKNLGAEVNSKYADYSPVISVDESMLLFTSRRPENIGGKTDDDGRYFEDIYISYMNEDENGWLPAKNIGLPINTPDHEATIGASIDGQIVFIYRNDADSGSIYTTSLQGENWTVPEKVGGDVNSKYWESHASLSADGSILYFVSNRPGGYGGRDIYRSKKLPSGKWGKPQNLGPNINTLYEEDSPFLQPGTNRLYFSSQGHKNMGGFDIFFSDYVDSGATGGWSIPQNMGYPVNTTGDDVFYLPTIDNKRAYYSSFAEGTYGDKDIYMLTLPENEESKLTVFKGSVLDIFGKQAKGVVVTVTDADNGELIGSYTPNAKTGRYLLILPHNKTFNISYSAEGLTTITKPYTVAPGKEYSETGMTFIMKDVVLPKEELGTIGVTGVVTNGKKKVVKNVIINVVENTTQKQVGKYYTDSKGMYAFALERGRNYNISFEAPGYLFQSENINMPRAKIYSIVEKNITLQPDTSGSRIILKNLFFDVNKSIIRKESFVELDKLYKFLKGKPALKVEVAGYTDNKGNDKLNVNLSYNRAKAVVAYLVKKGIKESRLVPKGYGKEEPVASNDTEVGRQQNRRVEVKIISEN